MDQDLPADDGRDLLAALDDDFFAEPPTNEERLRQVGAPAWTWLDTTNAACCADGLCSECESVI